MMAKLDATSHHWVASLANYKFQLYYRAGKTNIDADALSRVSWPRYVPDNLDTNHQVTAAAVWSIQEATLKDPVSPIEAYSCNLHILDPVGDGLQVTCMTKDNWHQVQWADPVLGLVIVRMQHGTVGQSPLKLTHPPELWQFLWECNHFKLGWDFLFRKLLSKESQEILFQLVLPAIYWETALRGCHNEISHLGLETMWNHFYWP